MSNLRSVGPCPLSPTQQQFASSKYMSCSRERPGAGWKFPDQSVTAAFPLSIISYVFFVTGHAHPNGNSHQQHNHLHPAQALRSAPSAAAKKPIQVIGIPSVSIQSNQLQVGNAESSQCLLRLIFRVMSAV